MKVLPGKFMEAGPLIFGREWVMGRDYFLQKRSKVVL